LLAYRHRQIFAAGGASRRVLGGSRIHCVPPMSDSSGRGGSMVIAFALA
jgi:hypothetical protein